MIERTRESNETENNILLEEESAERSENAFIPIKYLPPGATIRGGLAIAKLQLRISPVNKAGCKSHAGPLSPASPPDPPATKPLFEAPIPLSLEYFQALGIDALPGDIYHLKKLLPRATVSRNSLIRLYTETWQAAYQAEPVQHRKSNKARFAANQWFGSSVGYTK